MSWFRRRRPAPPAPRFIAPLTEWSVGDVALCLRDDWLGRPAGAPQKGRFYVVTEVVCGKAWELPHLSGIGLEFKPMSWAWHEAAFAKQPPLSAEERAAALEEARRDAQPPVPA